MTSDVTGEVAEAPAAAPVISIPENTNATALDASGRRPLSALLNEFDALVARTERPWVQFRPISPAVMPSGRPLAPSNSPSYSPRSPSPSYSPTSPPSYSPRSPSPDNNEDQADQFETAPLSTPDRVEAAFRDMLMTPPPPVSFPPGSGLLGGAPKG